MITSSTYLRPLWLFVVCPFVPAVADAGSDKPGGTEPITAVGQSSPFPGRLDVEVRHSPKNRLSVTLTFILGEKKDGRSLQYEAPDWLRQGQKWFVYPEAAERVWLFDGRSDVMLIECTSAKKKRPGGGEENVAVVRARSSSVNPDFLKDAPAAVKDRLPKKLLEGTGEE